MYIMFSFIVQIPNINKEQINKKQKQTISKAHFAQFTCCVETREQHQQSRTYPNQSSSDLFRCQKGAVHKDTSNLGSFQNQGRKKVKDNTKSSPPGTELHRH